MPCISDESEEMSIIAASVWQRSGELLVSRQFVEVDATRIHSYLGVVSRLFRSDFNSTIHEEDGIRYVFEALDELSVVLISDARLGNVLLELQTLRLFAGVVKETSAPDSASVDVKDIYDTIFTLSEVFDEVVTMGYTERLTVQQVDSFLYMESQEEKIQEIIERNKQLEAAESRKQRAKMLEAQRNNSDAVSSHGVPFAPAPAPVATFSPPEEFISPGTESVPVAPRASSGHGLRLGRKSASNDEHEPALPAPVRDEPVKPVAQRAHASPAASTSIDIAISEQLTVEMTRDGTVKSSRASGTLNLFAGDRAHSRLQLEAKVGGSVADFKPHPKTDRTLFASSQVLGLKNKDEEFPASNVLLVKWTVNNVQVPITFNSWVSDNGDGFMNVTLEYEVNPEYRGTLKNVAVKVPLPSNNAHADDPDAEFEQDEDSLTWLIPEASVANPSGSFEFVGEGEAEDDFYPIDVSFETQEVDSVAPLATFGNIDVASVVDRTTNEPVEFTKKARASTASYVIR